MIRAPGWRFEKARKLTERNEESGSGHYPRELGVRRASGVAGNGRRLPCAVGRDGGVAGSLHAAPLRVFPETAASLPEVGGERPMGVAGVFRVASWVSVNRAEAWASESRRCARPRGLPSSGVSGIHP